MEIVKNLNGNELVVCVSGRLDTTTAPQLEAELVNLDAAVSKLVFDIEGLEYLSSAGLRVLLSNHKAMVARGGSMEIVNANSMIKEIFDITGLAGVFTIK